MFDEKSLIVVPQENENLNIFEVLGRVRTFTSKINPRNYWDRKLHSQPRIDEDLENISKFLDSGDGLDDTSPNCYIRSGINTTIHALLKKLQAVDPGVCCVEMPTVIKIIGKAGIASPEIKADLLDLFHRGCNYSEKENSIPIIRHADLAAEALGKLYGADAFNDLLSYRSSLKHSAFYSKEIGRNVKVYESGILQGAMLGFAGTNLPKAAREIFSILEMRSPNKFLAVKVPVPRDAILYSGDEVIKTAVDALSRMGQEVIRSAVETASIQELVGFLTNYHEQAIESCGNYQPEILYKLILPYFSPAKTVDVLKVVSTEIGEEIVRFLPYGLKAEVVENARAERLTIPDLDKWDAEDLRRKQKKLDTVSDNLQESHLTDEEIRSLI